MNNLWYYSTGIGVPWAAERRPGGPARSGGRQTPPTGSIPTTGWSEELNNRDSNLATLRNNAVLPGHLYLYKLKWMIICSKCCAGWCSHRERSSPDISCHSTLLSNLMLSLSIGIFKSRWATLQDAVLNCCDCLRQYRTHRYMGIQEKKISW